MKKRIVNVGGCACFKFSPSPFSLSFTLSLDFAPKHSLKVVLIAVRHLVLFNAAIWLALFVFKVYFLSCYLATITENASLALFALTC